VTSIRTGAAGISRSRTPIRAARSAGDVSLQTVLSAARAGLPLPGPGSPVRRAATGAPPQVAVARDPPSTPAAARRTPNADL
jgi:hypothetical protein